MANVTTASTVKERISLKERSAIGIIEEAFYFLRLFPHTLFLYYLGSLPFVLGLLYFWADLSHTIYGTDYVARISLGLSLLFIWMKACHALFVENIYSHLSVQPRKRRSFIQIINMTSIQAIIHCTTFIVLPLALLITLPFGWVFAFYHHSSVVDQKDRNLKSVCREAWEHAMLWPKQNHLVIGLFFIFYIVVFFNISITLYITPYIFKTFLGIETVFTLSGSNFLNSTFLATAFFLTYLCVNPVIKTVYTLRYYYGRSLTSGDDLKTDLKSLKLKKILASAGLILMVLLSPNQTSAGDISLHEDTYIKDYQSGSVEALDASMDLVMDRREFAWRIPHQETNIEEESKGPLKLFIEWLKEMLKSAYAYLRDGLEKLYEWLKNLIPQYEPEVKNRPEITLSRLRTSLYALLVILLSTLSIIFIRVYQKRKSHIPPLRETPESTIPQIQDDDIKADKLSPNEWMTMAYDLIEQGEFRYAVRSLYLATLSHLATCEVITIKRYKSNHDYETELKRRAHEKMRLIEIFSRNVIFFNSVWYGRRSLVKNDVIRFADDQQKTIGLADA